MKEDNGSSRSASVTHSMAPSEMEDEDSDGAVNIIKQVNNQDMSSKTESERVSSKIIEE